MNTINYIKHLNKVLSLFSKDNRLNPAHISMYMALFRIWNDYHFKSEFYINRAELMDISKLGSTSTYHRCITQLSHWKYILYEPSHNPFKGSKIKMFDFGTTSELPVNIDHPIFDTTTNQAVISKNKHIKTGINNTNISKQKNNKKRKYSEEFKLNKSVPNKDNLRTTVDKNYNEPL